MANSRTECSGSIDRRAFLRVGSAGLLGLTLPDILRLEAEAKGSDDSARASSVIFIWLDGGPATIDMWDLKPEAPAAVRGEFRPIATSLPGVQVCEHLPRLAAVMDRVTLVRSLHHVINDHPAGARYVMTGRLPGGAAEPPALGSLAAALLPSRPGIPPFVRLLYSGGNVNQAGAGHLGPAYGPLQVDLAARGAQPRLEGVALPETFPASELEDRERLRRKLDRSFAKLDQSGLPAQLDRFQQQALDMLRADKTRRALDVFAAPRAVWNAYGGTPLGQVALAASRLIEAGARFVTIGAGGNWDTHGRQFPRMRDELLPPLDQALAALITDLDHKGLLENTIVYCVGEFGRTPTVNPGGGRDHWPASMAALLAGGGFRRGYVHGRTDKLGREPDRDPCTPADLAATIFDRLGFPPSHRLATVRDTSIFPDGRVVRHLVT